MRLDCNLRVTVASCIVLRRACSGGGEVRWSPADRLHEVVAACCQDGPRADDEHGRPAGGRSRRPRHPPAARPSRRRGVASCRPGRQPHRQILSQRRQLVDRGRATGGGRLLPHGRARHPGSPGARNQVVVVNQGGYIFYAGGSLAGASYCRQCRRRPAILQHQLWQRCQLCGNFRPTISNNSPI